MKGRHDRWIRVQMKKVEKVERVEEVENETERFPARSSQPLQLLVDDGWTTSPGGRMPDLTVKGNALILLNSGSWMQNSAAAPRVCAAWITCTNLAALMLLLARA